MKLKTLIFVLTCFATSRIGLAQDTLPPPDVEGLRDFLLTDLAYQEYPEDPFIWVVFFDLDHDGIPEAFATYKGYDYTGTGGGGYHWLFYRYKDGKWQRGQQRKDDGTIDESADVYAPLRDGFCSLTRTGQKPTLVARYSFHGKEENGKTFGYYAHETTIDDEGYLRDTPIPELSVELFAPWDEKTDTYIFPDFPPEYKSLSKLLVPVPVTVLHPREKPENGKSPSVAMAEQEGRAQVSLPSHEGEEESGTEKQQAPNRLWLYLGVSLLALCSVFYFLRGKKE